jgi:hypothetical protein
MAARVAAVAAAVLVVVAGLTLLNDDDERADIYAGPPSSTTVAPSTTDPGALAPTTLPDATTAPTTSPTTTAPTTTAPATRPITESSRMSLYGLGEVRGGMTIAEAEALTGQTFVVDSFDMAEGLCYFARIDGFDDLYFLIENDVAPTDPKQGIIGRASVGAGPWTTISGIGVGSTREEVLAAYGERITESPHAYVPGGSYLDFVPADAADSAYRLRFETDADGVVTEMHAGLTRPVGYIEGCA